jgi:lipid-binding SYLF domain-containing protein
MARVRKGSGSMARRLALVTILSTVMMAASFPGPLRAGEIEEARQLVEKSKLTFENFAADVNLGDLPDLLKKAKGILIVPQLLKGAFIIGASGGSGVLVVRDEKTGAWYGPAFYMIGGASFGLQIGGQASETILLAMTQRGVSSFLSNSFKLGADVGIAAGPVGVGASAATANLSADIISYSRSKGLYGGISLDGALVATRDEWNEVYYQGNTTDPGRARKVTTRDVLIRHSVTNPEAQGLLDAVARSQQEKPKAGQD